MFTQVLTADISDERSTGKAFIAIQSAVGFVINTNALTI